MIQYFFSWHSAELQHHLCSYRKVKKSFGFFSLHVLKRVGLANFRAKAEETCCKRYLAMEMSTEPRYLSIWNCWKKSGFKKRYGLAFAISYHCPKNSVLTLVIIWCICIDRTLVFSLCLRKNLPVWRDDLGVWWSVRSHQSPFMVFS